MDNQRKQAVDASATPGLQTVDDLGGWHYPDNNSDDATTASPLREAAVAAAASAEEAIQSEIQIATRSTHPRKSSNAKYGERPSPNSRQLLTDLSDMLQQRQCILLY
jgi:hypothetical protein